MIKKLIGCVGISLFITTALLPFDSNVHSLIKSKIALWLQERGVVVSSSKAISFSFPGIAVASADLTVAGASPITITNFSLTPTLSLSGLRYRLSAEGFDGNLTSAGIKASATEVAGDEVSFSQINLSKIPWLSSLGVTSGKADGKLKNFSSEGSATLALTILDLIISPIILDGGIKIPDVKVSTLTAEGVVKKENLDVTFSLSGPQASGKGKLASKGPLMQVAADITFTDEGATTLGPWLKLLGSPEVKADDTLSVNLSGVIPNVRVSFTRKLRPS